MFLIVWNPQEMIEITNNHVQYGKEDPELTYFHRHCELMADWTASAQQIIEVPHRDK